MFEELLESETEHGWKVKDFSPIQGHHLVMKIPDKERIVALPEKYLTRTIRNIVYIRGLVLRSTGPFTRKYSRKLWKWNPKKEDFEVKWRVTEAKIPSPSEISPGDGIVYNSYNVGKVRVKGVREPLVIVRELDIWAKFPYKDVYRIDLTEQAINCSDGY